MTRNIVSIGTGIVSLILTLTWLFGLWQSHVEDNGIALVSQANSLVRAGDPVSLGKAPAVFQKAADTFHGMNSDKQKRNEGLAYYGQARAFHALKQDAQAIEADKRAVLLLTSPDSKADLADTYNNLGVYYVALDKSDDAMQVYEKALPLYQALGLQDKTKKVLHVEAAIDYDKAASAAGKKDWPAARDACIQAQKLYHLASRPTEEADADHKLSLIYTAMGRPVDAAEARRQEQILRAATPTGAQQPSS